MRENSTKSQSKDGKRSNYTENKQLERRKERKGAEKVTAWSFAGNLIRRH